MKLIMQYNALLKKLQDLYPNSQLKALGRSEQQVTLNEHSTLTEYTNSNNFHEPPIETANKNEECRVEPEPEKFPTDFKFPIERVSHMLSVILADPEVTHTNLIFLNELVGLVFDKIRSLNM